MRHDALPESAILGAPSRPSASARAPLFVPALAFAAGCTWGSGAAALFWPAAATALLMAALWLQCRQARSSLLPFFAAVFLLGVANASLHKAWTPPDDLRRLPPSKFAADCRWEGTIGTVPLEKARRGAPTTTAVFDIRRASLPQRGQPASGRVLLEIRSAPAGSIVLSQRLRVRGALRRLGEPRNPGDPDWREIFSVRRITYRIQTSWGEVEPLDAGGWLGRAINAARGSAYRLLQNGLERDPQAVALLTGMLYGQTGGLPAKTEEDFRRAGAYHIFAVSGQNIGAVLAVGLALFEAARVSRWRWGWTLFPVVVFYALLSGGSASVGRAALLSSLVLAAWLLRRPLSLLNFWAASLLLLLGLNPLSVRDVSLQLSFGVVLALLLLGPPFSRALAAPFARDPFIPRRLLPRSARLLERCGTGSAFLLGSSLAASLGALPFEILHFHFVSLIGPLANLLVVPLAELIVSVGILSLCFGGLWSLLGTLLNNANWLFAHALLAAVALAARLPAAGIAAGDPSTLLSGSPGLRLLFPAVPLGTVCLVRWEGKVLLIRGTNGLGGLAAVEPIRRFYGWNWLDTQIQREGESWLAARRTPWGVDAPLAPFASLSPAKTLLLRPIWLPSRNGEPSSTRSALLIQAERLPVLALTLDPPFPGRSGEERMELFVEPESEDSSAKAAPRRPIAPIQLSLRANGAWLGEASRRTPTGIVRNLGRSAVEVLLEAGRIEFRPYRGLPVSYVVGITPGEEGAASQIPSSPEGSVQWQSGSNPFARRSRATPSSVKR